MISSSEGLKTLRAWSSEKGPRSLTITSKDVSASGIGILSLDEREISLTWDTGHLSITLPELVEFRLESPEVMGISFSEIKVLVIRHPASVLKH